MSHTTTPATPLNTPVQVAVPVPTTSSVATLGPFAVSRVPFEAQTYDVMGGCQRHEIKIHEHGFVALVDAMPRLVPVGQTADAAVVQAARVSYGQGTKKVSEDRGLIRYLLRHRHTTPFEMLEFKFHVAMPIFIARQWIRHRTASVNEYSARYSIVPDRFYKPTIDQVRKQSAANRQGGEQRFVADSAVAPDEAKTAEEFLKYLDEAEAMYEKYQKLTEAGVSREMARIALPVSVYTEWYWKCDLHNILRFLSLRMDSHAQEEIRIYAQAMWSLLEPIVPLTMEAFRDYELDGVRLTRLEIEALKSGSVTIATDNKREQAEWEAKRKAMGLG
ncbi:MAG: FAD-dependent thymidylate synthase [Phycisphaerales bacterium]|nr:FAD-dependent thymidylate synthase [Phycisphaerales bacterium]